MAYRKVVTLVCLQQRAAFSPHSLIGCNLKRKLFSAPRVNLKNGGSMWKRLLAYEAKETVRAIPVEQTATKVGWTGNL